MRMLFVCFVVVLFISGNVATPVDKADVIEASGETENSNNDADVKSVEKDVTEQLNSENEMPAEHIVEPIKRSKKSNYPSAPYPSAPYPSAPSVYPASSCAPCGGYSEQYAQPQISYGPPPYSGYPAPLPQYRPKYGGRKGSYIRPQPSYHGPQPSYQPPQPSYQPPPPSYQPPQPSYQPPQPTYQPVYSAPSPSYNSPSYDNHGYSAPAHPVSYSYPSPAPNVQCGSNVLVGCQPHVSEVPCSGYTPSYAPPEHHSAPAYRSNTPEEAEPSSLLPENPINEVIPDIADKKNSKTKTSKNDSVSSIMTVPSNVADQGTNNENKDDSNAGPPKEMNQLSPEEAKRKQYDTLIKMSELAKSLADNKGIPQPNQIPSSNPQKTMEKSTLPGPQPTSMNVNMNAAASNQMNTPYIPPQAKSTNPWV